MELVVTVMEAKELIQPSNMENLDTYVRIYLVPDETGALQTKVRKCVTLRDGLATKGIRVNFVSYLLWGKMVHSNASQSLFKLLEQRKN